MTPDQETELTNKILNLESERDVLKKRLETFADKEGIKSEIGTISNDLKVLRGELSALKGAPPTNTPPKKKEDESDFWGWLFN